MESMSWLCGPAVTMAQVKEHRLPSNPAKENEQPLFGDYVKRSKNKNSVGSAKALQVAFLRKCVHDAILNAIDVESTERRAGNARQRRSRTFPKCAREVGYQVAGR